MNYKVCTSFGDILLSDVSNKLIILDIDETILRLDNIIFTKYWIRWQIDQIENNSKYKLFTTRDELIKYINLHKFSPDVKFTLVEDSIKSILYEWLNKGYKIMFMTKRSIKDIDLTINHLSSTLDCKFSFNDLCKENIDCNRYSVTIKDSIVFNSANKGYCLDRLLEILNREYNYKPDEIFFVDDNKDNIDDVIAYNKNIICYLYVGYFSWEWNLKLSDEDLYNITL